MWKFDFTKSGSKTIRSKDKFEKNFEIWPILFRKLAYLRNQQISLTEFLFGKYTTIGTTSDINWTGAIKFVLLGWLISQSISQKLDFQNNFWRSYSDRPKSALPISLKTLMGDFSLLHKIFLKNFQVAKGVRQCWRIVFSTERLTHNMLFQTQTW